MATSPARPSSPVEENTPQENNEWKENFISPGDFMRFFFIHAVLPVISFAAAIRKLTRFCRRQIGKTGKDEFRIKLTINMVSIGCIKKICAFL